MSSWLFIHSSNAVLNNDREFVGEGWIICDQIGNRCGKQMTVTVLMLEAFSIQGSSSRRASQQEAFASHFRGSPYQIAYALKSEHGIINKEGNRIDAMSTIGSPGCDERCHGTGFIDPFFQNLPVLSFSVIQQLFESTGS